MAFTAPVGGQTFIGVTAKEEVKAIVKKSGDGVLGVKRKAIVTIVEYFDDD